MAITPGSRRRDTRTTVAGEPIDDPASLNNMQEPLGSTERPIHRTSDLNDVNLTDDGRVRTTGNLGPTPGRERSGRGFTATFAIVAAVLVAAFLIALYMGRDGINEASLPTSTAPVAETTPDTTPDATNDATGSTTPAAPSQETAPASGTTDAGGTTPNSTTTTTTVPANP